MTRWTVIIPYFNEETFLAQTLESLACQQGMPFDLILVDNGSTDRSAAVAAKKMAQYPLIPCQFISEPVPGKSAALEQGLKQVRTEFVAFADADTFYPPDYLATAQALFDNGQDLVAVLAIDIGQAYRHPASKYKLMLRTLMGRLLNKQAHSGGFGQAFRTDILRKAGGVFQDRWPFVLNDHEVMHRVLAFGRCGYSVRHWCRPSARRRNRSDVRWTLFERLLYHCTPYAHQDWLFYDFLAKRFEDRCMDSKRLREKSWRLPVEPS